MIRWNHLARRLAGAALLGLLVGSLGNRYLRPPRATGEVTVTPVTSETTAAASPLTALRRLLPARGHEQEWQAWATACETDSIPALRELLENLAQIPHPEMRQALKNIAFRRWFQLHAASAWEFTLTQSEKNAPGERWLVDGLTIWAELDPHAAARAANELPAGEIDAKAVVVSVVSETDADLSVGLAIQLGITDEYIYERIVGKLAATDPEGAAAVISKLPSAPMAIRENAVLATTAEWAFQDPRKALEWLTSVSPDDTTSLFTLGTIWASQDPEAVIPHIDTFTEFPDSRGALIAKIVAEWWKRDAAAAQTWLESIDIDADEAGAVQSRVIQALAEVDLEAAVLLDEETVSAGFDPNTTALTNAFLDADPTEALAWAQTLPVGQQRDRGIQAACERWAWADPEAVLQMLPDLAKQFSEDNPRHGPLAYKMVRALAGRGEEATQAWIEQLPPAYRRGYWDPYVRYWGEREPKATIDYLLTQDIERYQILAIQEAFAHWARQSPAAAAERIASITDVETRELATRNVLNQWAPADPAAAQAWVNRLTDPVQSQAAHAHLAQHPFADE